MSGTVSRPGEAKPFISRSHSTPPPPPNDTLKTAQWVTKARIFNVLGTLFAALATGAFTALYLSLPIPHVAIAVAAVVVITQVALYVLRRCAKDTAVNQEIPLEDCFKPAIERATPPLVKKYMQWFKEAAGNTVKPSTEHFVANYDALMGYSGRYGLRVLKWAKECDVKLSPEDKLYKDLVEVFFTHLSHHFIPTGEKMEASFQRTPEEFSQDMQTVGEPFFVSKEHENQVKMILLNFKRRQEGGKSLEDQFKADLLEAAAMVGEAMQEDAKKVLTDENQDKMILFMHDACMKINRYELEQLRPQLIAILGEKTAHAAIEEGVLVSSDVRLGLSLLTQQGKDLILQKAQEMKDQLAQADKDIDKLRFSIMKSLPAEPRVIFEHLPSLKQLQQLPGDQGKRLREQFNTIVNRVVLNARMKDRGLFFQGLRAERYVLKTLNYANVETYDSKIREGYQLLQDMMINMLPPVILGQFKTKNLRSQLNKMAFETRLQAVGVNQMHHEHIKSVIESVAHIKEALYKKYGKNAGKFISLLDREAFEKKLPKALKYLESTKDSHFHELSHVYAEQFIEKEKDWIRANLHLSTPEFKKKWGEKVIAYINDPSIADGLNDSYVEENLKAKVEFYREFLNESVSVVEYEQGEDGSGSILGKGICRAKAFDVERQLLEDPKKALKDLNVDAATPDQRFIQAQYGVAFEMHKGKTGNQRYLIPEALLTKYNVKETQSDFISTMDQMITHLKTQYEPLQKTNPAFSISVWCPGAGHQISIRFDHDNKRYIFYDANHLIGESTGGVEWLERVLRKWKAADWDNATSFACVHLTKK